MKKTTFGLAAAFLLCQPIAANALQDEAEQDEAEQDAAGQDVAETAPASTLSPAEEYSQLLATLEQTQRYNASLTRQVESQNSEIASLLSANEDIVELKPKVLALTEQMLERYTELVETDPPFNLTERRERVARYRAALSADDAEENIAQNYRLLLEAHQIEIDAGRVIASYAESYLDEAGNEVLDENDNPELTEYLRVGRIALIKINEKRGILQWWDQRQRTWVDLPSSYLPDVRLGLRMAKEQTAPGLLPIPVPPPTVN